MIDPNKPVTFGQAKNQPVFLASVPEGTYAKGDTFETFMLSEKHLAELSTLLSANIMNATDLMRAARNVSTVSVQGIKVTLEPYLLDRLHSRCHPTDNFPDFLRARLLELLAGYCGC